MFISLDIETTGFDAKKDKIIEFGAVKFDLNGAREEISVLINPGIKVPEIITHITGIKDSDLSNAPTFEEKLDEFKNFIGDLPIIGHNIHFDTTFLNAKGLVLNNPEYDTLEFAGILMPNLVSYSLEIISSKLKLTHKEKHRALDDSIAAMELFLRLTDEFQKLSPEVLSEIKKVLNKSSWPLKDFLLTLHSSGTTRTIKAVTKKSKDSLPDLAKEILNIDNNILIEKDGPYEELAKSLVLNSSNEDYVCVPNQLFNALSNDLPENIAQIDSPKNYLSPKRLNEFLEQDHFENHETISLLKYIIWARQTRTGLLSKLNLLGKEKNTIYKVNADENFTNPTNEPFVKKALEKDSTSPALISHEYLIEKSPILPNLILLDFDKFIKRLSMLSGDFMMLSHLINILEELKNHTEEIDLLEQLESKTTIIFGLAGIFFEKYNNQNPYAPKVLLEAEFINLKEFKDIRMAVLNLIEFSQELGKILNDKTAPTLKLWKTRLKTLHEIFVEPDTDNYLIAIEQNYQNETVLKKTPTSIDTPLKKILNNCQNYKIIDENIDLMDDGKFFKRSFNLDSDLPIRKFTEKPKDLQIELIKGLPEYETPQNKTKSIDIILDTIKETTGNLAIICTSKAQLSHVTLSLGKILPKKIKLISQMTGSISKITEKFKEDPSHSILILTPNAWETFNAHDQIEKLIITKIPFESPETDYMLIHGKSFDDPMNELTVPKAIISLKKIIKKIKKGKVFILDSRIFTKEYGQIFIKNLENIGNLCT